MDVAALPFHHIEGAEHADAMVAALDGSSGRLVRHTLTTDAARQREAAVASAPVAAGSP